MIRPSLPILLALANAIGGGCAARNVEPLDSGATSMEADPLDELRAIPDQIQAEVDLVLQPINDVDVVLDQLASLPHTLGVAEEPLRGMAARSVASSDPIAIELDLDTEAQAEVRAVLLHLQGIAADLRRTSARVESASAELVALGARATALVTTLTTHIQARLSSPSLTANDQAALQAELDLVTTLAGDIEIAVAAAQQSVAALPTKGDQALERLTAAFTSEASASAG